jgi:hypothetical protein
MVTQQERARLMEDYKDRPVYAAALVIKCGVCLFVISGLAVIGVQSNLGYDAARMQAQQVRDTQRIITVRVKCQDAATIASGQPPEKIKTASAAAPESRKPYVSLPLLVTKSC